MPDSVLCYGKEALDSSPVSYRLYTKNMGWTRNLAFRKMRPRRKAIHSKLHSTYRIFSAAYIPPNRLSRKTLLP